MAQKAKKDRAKSNAASLNNLHVGSLVVHVLFLLSHFLFRSRSLLVYGLVSVPSFICEYILETSGRPKYDAATGALKSSGEDLAAAGLTEYMFDVIWVTWGSLISAILFGKWGWMLYAVVPAYGAYLAYGLLGMGKNALASMQGGGGGVDNNAAPQGNRRARRTA